MYILIDFRNKWIHIICVPLLFATILGLLHGIKLFTVGKYEISASLVLLIVVLIYYMFLSVPIAVILH